eukprot:TRINITY_DN5427_c0_g5_i1.p1 TRINITY_DN5427_c0_g5~~TRINITY_DN5427_c0_g5_i1.p1  ORF type:complete len:311 (-),score=85.77 TRINITY_DN5427_c0_g5_i1:112-969(-)
MAEAQDFMSKVIGAASQGAVGAVVAASLSSVTEPIVNRVLVNRVPLTQAIQELDPKKIVEFMKTTMTTNFIKFPFFEATNVIMSSVEIPDALRGTVTGAVFCTTTLPITNYRFRKSMNLPVNPKDLYQAYLPTVLRDVLYGIVRNKTMAYMISLDPKRANTNLWRFINMFVTVMVSCVLSAPGNELRGYCLQPPAKRLPFGEFFKPDKFVRSTTVGGLIMSVSLGVGTLATPQVQRLWQALREYFRTNPSGYLIVLLFALHQYLENKRHKLALEAKAPKEEAKKR